jgi:OmpA-OmpF porin, OOP family
MSNRYTAYLVLTGLCMLLAWPSFAQRGKYSASAVALRGVFSNFIGPVNDEYRGAYGAGLEMEYLYFFHPRISVSLPAYMIQSDMFELDEPDSRFEAVHLGFGLRAGLWPFGDKRLLSPRLFGGLNVAWEEYSDRRTYFPVGLGANLRVTGSTYLTAEVSYHNSLQDATVTQDRRDYLQLAGGLYLNITRINELVNEPEIADTDGDGIADSEDLCPEEAGSLALNGCPDRDEDGIADGSDDCPDVAGEVSFRGCPDTDKDGIRDLDDDCPTQAGTAAYRGCPVPDRDNDGVLDDVDRCPDQSGLARLQGCPDTDADGIADPDDDCPEVFGPAANGGCPEEEVATEPVSVDLTVENVNFALNSSVLLPSSNTPLDRVAELLREYPEFDLRLTGYTDDSGTEDYNQWLSERRARSVFEYLVGKGVAAERISYQGAGSSNPIADNRTEAGRAQNRRVTFELYERE